MTELTSLKKEQLFRDVRDFAQKCAGDARYMTRYVAKGGYYKQDYKPAQALTVHIYNLTLVFPGVAEAYNYFKENYPDFPIVK